MLLPGDANGVSSTVDNISGNCTDELSVEFETVVLQTPRSQGVALRSSFINKVGEGLSVIQRFNVCIILTSVVLTSVVIFIDC